MPHASSRSQGEHEDDHAQEAEDALRGGADEVADEDAAGGAAGAPPVVALGSGRTYPGPVGPLGRGSVAAPEVLAEKDAGDGAEDQAEEGADAEEEEADQRADDAADGAARGPPVARAEAPGAVAHADEVRDEGQGREEAEEGHDPASDDLEARREGVDEGRDEDQGDPGKRREHAAHEPDEHRDQGDDEERALREVEHQERTGRDFLPFFLRAAFRLPDL